MSAFTQKNRNLSIGTPLGSDKLLLHAFDYTEQLGRLFAMDADLLSEDHQIPFDAIVGKNVTIRLESAAGGTRHFNGYVSRFEQTGSHGRLTQYRARIVPWLWFLTRASDCRIFQNKTVPDIIKEVFRVAGFTDFTEKLTAVYGPWPYCVQYRETDFNFVSRLMEQEGIYYYFQHENGAHKMVLADGPGSHAPGKDAASGIFHTEDSGTGDLNCITSFQMGQEVMSGSFALSDFNFETPRNSILARSQINNDHDQSKFEMFDYPGEYEKQTDGTEYSKVRIEELQAQHLVGQGSAGMRRLCAGNTLAMRGHYRRDWNKTYLLTSILLRASGDAFESAAETGKGNFFSCRFTVIDSQTPFRAPRTTPKPVVKGPQTAIVVGPKGEEIHTDKYGRIKVQFHWDRYGKADENSSCWVRVSQAAWAGKGWGSVHIPRVGQEVIVEFLEGDPDQPIVTGRVYNGDCKPPYDLPAEKTKSTLKSNSSKGGNGFNELRFEDKKAAEQIYLHAEKELRIKVKDSTREWNGGNRDLVVKKDQVEQILGDKHSTVVGERHTQIQSSDSVIISEDSMTRVNGTLSLVVQGDQQEKVGGNLATNVGGEIHLKAGTQIILEAGSRITLKVGGSFIDIGPSGIAIQGSMVRINSGGSAGSGHGSAPQAPGKPKAPKEPEPIHGGSDTTITRSGFKRTPSKSGSSRVDPKANVLLAAAKSGVPFCEIC